MARSLAVLEDMRSAPKTFLEVLPRELRDHIFEYAYREGPDVVRTMQYRFWRCNETSRRSSSSLVPGQLPATSSLNFSHVRPFRGMLVNRQFFEEAATVYSRFKTINLGHMSSLDSYSGYPQESIRATGTLPTTILNAKIVWDRWDQGTHSRLRGLLASLGEYPTLQKLEITVDRDVMMDLGLGEDDFAWSHEYTDCDFQQIRGLQFVTELISLKSVKLIPGNNDFVDSVEEQFRYEKNVASLENYLMRKLLHRKADPTRAAEEDVADEEEDDGGENSKEEERCNPQIEHVDDDSVIVYCYVCDHPVRMMKCEHVNRQRGNMGLIIEWCKLTLWLVTVILIAYWMFGEGGAVRAATTF